ncbi:MAG: WYL domain-containing protein, partial [bacterium]
MPSQGSYHVLQNILTLLRLIQSGKYMTRKVLARELGCHVKTVGRYLDTLSLVGFDFDSDEDGNFKPIIRLRQGARQQTFEHMILLEKDELLELYLHLQGVHHAAGIKSGGRLFDKIANAMGGARVSARQFAPMLTDFEKGYKSYRDKKRQGVIATLLEALSANLACQVTYQSPDGGKPTVFRIEPYQLFEFDGGLYCYCHVPHYKNVRMLAVERMEKLKINEDEIFTRKKAVLKTIEEKKARAFRIVDDEKLLKVKLKFTPRVAFYVKERVWHQSQQLKDEKDGGVTLEFEASGRVEIERWIMRMKVENSERRLILNLHP